MWERWHNHLHRGEFKEDVSHAAQQAFRWRIHPKALNAGGNRGSGSALWSLCCQGQASLRSKYSRSVWLCVFVCVCVAALRVRDLTVFRKVVLLALMAWSGCWCDAPGLRFPPCSCVHVQRDGKSDYARCRHLFHIKALGQTTGPTVARLRSRPRYSIPAQWESIFLLAAHMLNRPSCTWGSLCRVTWMWASEHRALLNTEEGKTLLILITRHR